MGKHKRRLFIEFIEVSNSPLEKHLEWRVQPTGPGPYIGYVRWSEGHKSYIFHAACPAYDHRTLRDISHFCAERTREFWEVLKGGGK